MRWGFLSWIWSRVLMSTLEPRWLWVVLLVSSCLSASVFGSFAHVVQALTWEFVCVHLYFKFSHHSIIDRASSLQVRIAVGNGGYNTWMQRSDRLSCSSIKHHPRCWKVRNQRNPTHVVAWVRRSLLLVAVPFLGITSKQGDQNTKGPNSIATPRK